MNFTTKVDIRNNPWTLHVEDKLLTLGSCFSDNIAEKMREYFLRVTSNPFGTLYNPISIAHHMNSKEVQDADVILVTFGTSWVYMLDGEVVDNCQKRPASLFIRRRLTVNEIVGQWRSILEKNPQKRFIFTVSPIRHVKDGLHENHISKAILLQAIDEIIHGTPTRAVYFPSYEILMDELRDYRFYAEDMLHPSKTAIDYLWERFRIMFYYTQITAGKLHELHQLWLDNNHRPLHPDTEEARAFKKHLEQEFRQLHLQYEWIELTEENK